MATESVGGGNPRRITVINIDSLSEEEIVLLEGLFGNRERWPIFLWNPDMKEWDRDDPIKPLNPSNE